MSDSMPKSGTTPAWAGLMPATDWPTLAAATAVAAVTTVFPIPVSVPETSQMVTTTARFARCRREARGRRVHGSLADARSRRTLGDGVQGGFEVGAGHPDVDRQPQARATARSGRWPEAADRHPAYPAGVGPRHRLLRPPRPGRH